MKIWSQHIYFKVVVKITKNKKQRNDKQINKA